MPSLSYIQGHIQDIDQLSWLSREFFQESLLRDAGAEAMERIDNLFSRSIILEDLNDPEVEYWIVQLESKGIGYLRLQHNHPNKGSICLNRLILLQAYWTRERLESLLSFAEYRASRTNLQPLYLVGWEILHPGRKSFEKLGYTATEVDLNDQLGALQLRRQKFVKHPEVAAADAP